MADPARVRLHAEPQASAPFTEAVRAEANPMMRTVPGLRSKTLLSGIDTHSVGGFCAFDSVANARAYAEGKLSGVAKAANATLTVRLFDGDVVAEASRGMNAPFCA
jgi:hypothetical protein